MDIEEQTERETIIIEPLEDPVPRREPEPERVPEQEPERVPVGV